MWPCMPRNIDFEVIKHCFFSVLKWSVTSVCILCCRSLFNASESNPAWILLICIAFLDKKFRDKYVLRGFPPRELISVLLSRLSVGGWVASLCVAGYTALTVRKIVKTELIPAETMTKPPPFTSTEIGAWTAVFISSFVLASLAPTALGTSARTSLPFLLAATVLGYMVGSG